MKKYLLCGALVAALATTSAHADGMYYNVFGPGVSSCGSMQSEIRQKEEWAEFGYWVWLEGYVSALGAAKVIDNSRLTPNSIASWVGAYCQSNPQLTVENALLAFLREKVGFVPAERPL
jgi:hypothetical protein